ncbi:hypothetical protein J4450_06300 [Candidatus Micrarchaeota archaeon]|nr:hypothetical protein [Candidatus Micrarchaeota archaeon]
MKVLVGSPVSKHHKYCAPQYLEMLKNLSYSNYDVLLVDNSDTEDFYNEIKDKVLIVRFGYDKETIKERMVASRNYIREYVLKNGYDYFMDIDQDVIPPKDVIERMLAHKKDFVSGIYYNYFEQIPGKREKMPVAYTWFTKDDIGRIMGDLEKVKVKDPPLYRALVTKNFDFSQLMRPLSEEEIKSGKLIKIRSCGSGCTLVSRRALEAVPFRNNYIGGFDDVLFCIDLLEKGFELYADCSVVCDHLNENKPWEWTRVGKITDIIYK